MEKREKNHSTNYNRVMPRVFNSSRSSFKSNSGVIRHEIPSSVRVCSKPTFTNASSRVFSELPTVLGDYVPDTVREKRTVVVKPRKTLKSLDPAKTAVQLDLRTVRNRSRLRSQGSAPVVSREVRWSGSDVKCFSSRSQKELYDLKKEIKDYEETESLLKLRSKLYKKCGVVLDDLGQVAEDKAVQAGGEDKEQIEKRDRINFTSGETERLQSLITKHQNILFSKKTDGVSNKQKDEVWSLIHFEFNALGETPRSIKQLKYKYENMKRVAKKVASKERQDMRRTGGGPAPPPPGPNDTTDWLRSLMPVSIDGNEAVYDDDLITKQPPPTKQPDLKIDLIELHDEYTEDIHVGEKIAANKLSPTKVFDASTPFSSLKRPVASPLKRQAKRLKVAENNIRDLLREKKISLIDSLQQLELQKIKDSIQHAQEVHDQAMLFNQERHKLEIEKLQLEIQILKKTFEE